MYLSQQTFSVLNALKKKQKFTVSASPDLVFPLFYYVSFCGHYTAYDAILYYKSKAMVFFFMPFTARLPVAVPSLPTWDQYKSRFVSFLPKMDTDYL